MDDAGNDVADINNTTMTVKRTSGPPTACAARAMRDAITNIMGRSDQDEPSATTSKQCDYHCWAGDIEIPF
jgi:hypothetical protein